MVPIPMLAMASPARERLQLQTANGTISFKRQIDLTLPGLSLPVEALLLPQSPPVLSLGRRRMEQGFSFRWDAGQEPQFLSPDGTLAPLVVKGYIPYIVTDATACLPAAPRR